MSKSVLLFVKFWSTSRFVKFRLLFRNQSKHYHIKYLHCICTIFQLSVLTPMRERNMETRSMCRRCIVSLQHAYTGVNSFLEVSAENGYVIQKIEKLRERSLTPEYKSPTLRKRLRTASGSRCDQRAIRDFSSTKLREEMKEYEKNSSFDRLLKIDDVNNWTILQNYVSTHAPTVNTCLRSIAKRTKGAWNPRIGAAFSILAFNRNRRRNKFQQAVAFLLGKWTNSVKVSINTSYIFLGT